MKRLLALLLVLVFVAVSEVSAAKPITKEAAKVVARNFYFENVNLGKNVPCSTIKASLIFTEIQQSKVYWYIFSMEPSGFVIVSATDAVVPVLGYSFDDVASETDIPENFAGWISHYKAEIQDAIDNPSNRIEGIDKEWTRLLSDNFAGTSPKNGVKSVSPMIVSNWDQGKYYNQFCPADAAGPDGHCVTGCVATAMGMIAYYYRWPLTGTSSYSYTHPIYGTIGANFGNAVYDWNSMSTVLNTYNPSSAEMIFHMGASVDMDYGPAGSGMWNHKAAYSLRTYFKYVPQTQYLFRDSTNLDWDSILVKHLDRKQILYYAGWAAVGSTSGHAFICDGYQDTTYFHFNWGWSASYNGYFYLNALNPGGSNFNYAQELVLNIHPDTISSTYPYYCTGLTSVHSPNGTLEDGSGPIKDYIPNAACSWLIDPQVNPEDSIKSITITFNRFDTETAQDFLTIYNGATTSAPVLGNYSGNSLPPSITSTSNKVLIVFTSNATINKSGWHLSYKSNYPVYCINSQFSTPTGTISDGSGSKYYLNNTICTYTIQPANAAALKLHFNSFQTEPTVDFLEVYDLGTSNLLGRFSGSSIPADQTANSGGMYLVFKTNGKNTSAGWEATYSVTNLGIADEGKSGSFLFYPNPADESAILDIKSDRISSWQIDILTVDGQLAYSGTVKVTPPQSSSSLNLSGLQNGLYLLRIQNEKNIYQKKISVQH